MTPAPLTAENLESLESSRVVTQPEPVLAAKGNVPKLSLDVSFSTHPASLPSPTTTPTNGTQPAMVAAGVGATPPHLLKTAAQAVVPQEKAGVLYSPTVASIVQAFQEEGEGDKELLKAVLLAKAKEDERLAARDLLKAEQLRAATLLAQSQQYYYQAAHYAALSPTTPDSATSSYPPWRTDDRLYPPPYSQPHPHPSVLRQPNGVLLSPASPQHLPFRGMGSRTTSSSSLSPPSQYLEPYDERDPRDAKRKRESTSVTGESGRPASSKKAKSAPVSPHEQAMQALRARCQRNKVEVVPAGGPSASSISTGKRSEQDSATICASGERRETAKPRKKRFIAAPLSPPDCASSSPPSTASATQEHSRASSPPPPVLTQSPPPHSQASTTLAPLRSYKVASPSRPLAITSSVRSTSHSPPLASAARFNNPLGRKSTSPPPSSSLRMLLNATGSVAATYRDAFRAETSDVRSS